ncbi:hypothetical protein BCR36DRAFT_365561 [Piromyces finnis]|uniref:Uncharacterized protein n=1 Tax=Piromyces finnis TaxID=1754191 RepID=A0A1Y1VNI6_9FUNG|nr:hypothetical protein BCR36DRAFT_365561 [Piromyces finnis]|eukprot:ORX60977.1 hypothetical protein BCR36DRAFT_365561 [Piromyces finnis]
MNIDINEINDLDDVIYSSTEKNNEDTDTKDENKLNNDNSDISTENINDINNKIFSWKTVIENFKGSCTEKEQSVPKNNYINNIDLIPCHETIKLSKENEELKLEQPLLPNLEEHFLSNINTPFFFEPILMEQNNSLK